MGRKIHSRLKIRHAVPDDYSGVARIFEGPQVIWGTLQTPYPSPEIWRKRLSEVEEGLSLLVACEGSDLVGMAGLHTRPGQPRRRHAASIGMTVRDDRQGRGVGTALLKAILDLADGWMNLSRLELEVFTDNAHAISLYQRHGFEIEGTLREYALRDGQLIDAYVMGRLRPQTKGKRA